MFKTIDIWRGIYSSHQRCLEAVQRLGLTLRSKDNALVPDDYLQLLQYRLKTAKAEKKAEVERRIAALTTRKVKPVESEPPAEPVLDTPTQHGNGKPAFLHLLEQLADWATSKAMIFLTLVGALMIQVHHVAQLVNNISESDSLLLGYVFGSVSELTALMLTVHQARKSMLIVFAFIQCWINILYYCHLPALTVKLTLSALIAFVIYAYSELYTATQQEKFANAPH